ncbi:insulinase family protein [bacterium]|jgi:zinc protease|nr:insulinase family protein [bacterium]
MKTLKIKLLIFLSLSFGVLFCKQEVKNIVHKKVLDNGLTILVYSAKHFPKVTLQMWYNVGARDEVDGKRGIAHFTEHLVGSGTKEMLSAADVSALAGRLSGCENAFTSHDYTTYSFSVPSCHWKETLPIFSDCMENCLFSQDVMTSELNAVIQELKMKKNNPATAIVWGLSSATLSGTCYAHSLIGYKDDLINMKREDIQEFYDQFYAPNNATLVVVGDVCVDDVFDCACEEFSSLSAKTGLERGLFFNKEEKEISSRSLMLYRDVKRPLVGCSFIVSLDSCRDDFAIDALGKILTDGKGSRLYKKLVSELSLVSSVSFFSWGNFGAPVAFIFFEPHDENDIEKIFVIIQEELNKIAENGLSADEALRIKSQSKIDFFSACEDDFGLAVEIGRSFLCFGRENHVFEKFNYDAELLCGNIKNLVKENFRKTCMNKGVVLPLPDDEKSRWLRMQDETDTADAKRLEGIEKNNKISLPKYALTVKPKRPESYSFPRAETFYLENGMKILYNNSNDLPKVCVFLCLKAEWFFDSESLPGIYSFLSEMLLEGTKNYTSTNLARELEIRGISLSISPGSISLECLKEDLEFSLEIIEEILSRSLFDDDCIETIRKKMLTGLKAFLDSPSRVAYSMAFKHIYGKHPYGKNIFGTKESIEKINKKDLISFYKKYITPDGAKCAIVGDLDGINLEKIVIKTIGKWSGPKVDNIDFPKIENIPTKNIDCHMNVDQVDLVFVGPSVSREHSDFYKLFLFNYIFSGGLASKLYQLRRESGLFYVVHGDSLIMSDKEPGVVTIYTQVSKSRMEEAEQSIKELVRGVADTITQQELDDARNQVIFSLPSYYSTITSTAKSFLRIDKFDFSSDYHNFLPQKLFKISLVDVKNAVKRWIGAGALSLIRVGRV